MNLPQLVKSSGQVTSPIRIGKSGKMGRHLPVREKSRNFEQAGKVRKFQIDVINQFFSLKKKTKKNTGKVGEFCQSGKVGDMEVSHLI